MAVFVEAGRGRREGDPGKSISGAVRGTSGRRYRPVGGGKVKVNVSQYTVFAVGETSNQ